MAAALTLSGVVDMVTYAIKMLITLAYFVGTAMVVYAGFRMAWSRGDEKAFGDAKKMLWYAIIGLVVMFGVQLIVSTIQQFGQSPDVIIN